MSTAGKGLEGRLLRQLGLAGMGGWEWAGWSGDPLHWLREARECPSCRLAGLEPLGYQGSRAHFLLGPHS